MNHLIDNPEKENIIFTQAIDQNYENTKENLNDFSDENFENFVENGDLKLNLDFIDFYDEFLINTKNDHKKSEGNLSNSCESSESTDFDSFPFNRSKSENRFLTENKHNFKIKDFLCPKYEEDFNKNLSSEIQKLKDNLKKATQEKIFFTGNNDNKISSFANFPIGASPQNDIKNFCKSSPPRQMGLICGNFPMGFFQQQPANQNINLESSIFKKERKYSYQPNSNGSSYLEF